MSPGKIAVIAAVAALLVVLHEKTSTSGEYYYDEEEMKRWVLAVRATAISASITRIWAGSAWMTYLMASTAILTKPQRIPTANVRWSTKRNERGFMSDVLNTQLPDPCCSKPWSKAARDGSLDQISEWSCPKCGTVWTPRLLDGQIAHWEPVCDMYVFKVAAR